MVIIDVGKGGCALENLGDGVNFSCLFPQNKICENYILGTFYTFMFNLSLNFVSQPNLE